MGKCHTDQKSRAFRRLRRLRRLKEQNGFRIKSGMTKGVCTINSVTPDNLVTPDLIRGLSGFEIDATKSITSEFKTPLF